MNPSRPPSAARPRIAVVVGTRPEAIKMAPLVLALRASAHLDVRLVSTGQHRTMLDDAFALFDLVPDVSLDVMARASGLSDVTAAVLSGLAREFTARPPAMVLVHGDTGTAFAAALASYHCRVPVGHVEAGLRTHDLLSPWPEEGNRRLVGVLARRHYAPTARARDNLLAENVDPASVRVTGNTVIDALLSVVARLEADPGLGARATAALELPDDGKRLVLVTGHRRENVGAGFESICRALATLGARGDVRVVYPVHLNPNVAGPVRRLLGDAPNVHLVEPLDYLGFVRLMSRSHLILTDSGGIQEEAPALGVPVLVMRDTTERPEALEAGTVRLVGTDPDRLVAEVARLLDDAAHHESMARAVNPFGDGTACARIVEDLESMWRPAPA